MKNKQAVSQGQNPNDALTKRHFLFWCQAIYSWCDLCFRPVTGSAKRIRGLEISFHYFLMNIGKAASFTRGLWLQHNCQVIVKEMRSVEAELRELWSHMGRRGKRYDSDGKHMVVHLQAALARFPGLEKDPCISIEPLFKEISEKQLDFNKLFTVMRALGSISMWAQTELLKPTSCSKACKPFVQFLLPLTGQQATLQELLSNPVRTPQQPISKLPRAQPSLSASLSWNAPFDINHTFFSPQRSWILEH